MSSKPEEKPSSGPWQAQIVAEAFCRAEGQEPSLKIHCQTCGITHELWERHLIAAERFVAGFDALKKVQKENLS